MSFEGTFEVAGGSVTGRSHASAGRCNQDAYAWSLRGESLVAVVCDGCGSGAQSEVGARIGARLVTERLSRALAAGGSLAAHGPWEEVRRGVLGDLGALAAAMGGRLRETVAELLLFTVVGVAITRDEACVFALGDGLFALNGEARRLGPFPRNEPPYLAYGLLDADAAPRFVVHDVVPTAELRAVLIGTDGAVDLLEAAGQRLPGEDEAVAPPLCRFWEDDWHFKNRDGVRRTLARMNREVARPVWAERRVIREPGLLEDDTTVVVVRRRA